MGAGRGAPPVGKGRGLAGGRTTAPREGRQPQCGCDTVKGGDCAHSLGEFKSERDEMPWAKHKRTIFFLPASCQYLQIQNLSYLCQEIGQNCNHLWTPQRPFHVSSRPLANNEHARWFQVRGAAEEMGRARPGGAQLLRGARAQLFPGYVSCSLGMSVVPWVCQLYPGYVSCSLGMSAVP